MTAPPTEAVNRSLAKQIVLAVGISVIAVGVVLATGAIIASGQESWFKLFVLYQALLLSFIVAVYWGFALRSDNDRETPLQLLFPLPLFVLAWTGAYLSNTVGLTLIALGLFAHGIWDVLHQGRFRTLNLDVPHWYALFCVFIDWAALLLVLAVILGR